MQQSDLLKIRDRADMRVQHELIDNVFAVRVQDVTDEGIFLDRPIIDQTYFPSAVGLTVEISYQRPDATYRFKSRVMKEGYLGRLPVILVEHPKELDRIQRRQYFRLDVDLPVVFRPSGVESDAPGEDYRRGLMIDLSAGGIKFKTLTARMFGLATGDLIKVTFNLSRDVSIIDAESIILKIEQDKDVPKQLSVICRFIDLPAKQREAIIVHNIRTQRRYRLLKES